MPSGSHHAVLLVAALAAVGCTTEDDGDDGAIPSGSTSGPPPGASSSEEGGDSSSGGPPVDALPQCRKACDVPAMCCPPGSEGCPSSDYPFNFGCVDNVCTDAECSGDGDCDDGFSCVTFEGKSQCLVTCGAGSDCTAAGADAECIGILDDGSGYCLESCVGNPVACGNATCDEASGRCTCSSSEQCIVGFECA